MALLISSVEGNHQWLDGGAMFGNVPRALWETWAPADGAGRIRLSCRGLLIESEGCRVLCETGIGAFFDEKLAARYGVEETEHVLLRSLETLGLRDSDIDLVILSHLHFDHAGGLLPTYDEIRRGRTDLLFPRAHYVVGREAFQRAKSPHPRDRASFIPGLVEKLEASGRLVLIDETLPRGRYLVPEALAERLSFRLSHGHTPGHLHTVVRGDHQSLIFAGDLIPGTAWIHVPVSMGYDRFAELVIDEKTTLYKEAADQGWLFFYTHDQKCVASKIVADAKGRYGASDQVPRLERWAL